MTAPNSLAGSAAGADSRSVYSASGEGLRTERSKWSFRPDIEGFRAVAILMVVLFHAGVPWARGGFLGVDVFFVLSGYLITGVLVSEVERTGRVNLLNFWARRARRLLPAATTVTLLTIAGSYFAGSLFDLVKFMKSATAFAFYGSNVVFARRAQDYFAPAAARDPLLHTWSLSVEEQFYLIFAPIVLGIAIWTVRSGRTSVRMRLQGLLLTASVASFGFALSIVHVRHAAAFYLLPSRAWEFGIGALLVTGQQKIGGLGRRACNLLAVFALLVLVASTGLIDSSAMHPGWITLAPVIATAVVIASAAGGPTAVSELLGTAPLMWVGRVSYSWYLWHWPALVFLGDLVARPSLPLRLAVVVASLVPAYLAYRFLESPIRHSQRLARRPGLTLLGAGALATVAVAAVGVAILANGIRMTDPAIRQIISAHAAQPALYEHGCHSGFAEVKPSMCAFGSQQSDTDVVLFGDSHAAQWFPALDSIANQRGWRLTPVTKSSCPSVNVSVARDDRRYVECDVWHQLAFDAIAKRHPKYVVISNFRHYNVFFKDHAASLDSSATALQAWRLGLEATIDRLRQTGAHVVLLRDPPSPSFDESSCLIRHTRDAGACNFYWSRAVVSRLTQAEDAIASSAGVRVVDLSARICPDVRCQSIHNGMLVFRDENHLTVPFTLTLVGALDTLLANAVGLPVQSGAGLGKLH